MIDEKLSEEYGFPVDDMVLYNDMGDIIASKPRRETYFGKVSYQQFKQDWLKAFPPRSEFLTEEEIDTIIQQIYDGIELPTRSTMHSAGHDFKNPMWFKLQPQESIMIPTGIRCHMRNDLVLMIYPRSGLGTKYRLIPRNLTCVIDADYYYADNEGHIMMHLINEGDKEVTIEQGKAFCQGIFTQYFTTDDDEATGVRNGGMGSTDIH